MKQLTPEQVALLKKPLPAEAISQHPSKKFLSTIKAIYVTERLNDVFGIGSWTTKVEFVNESTGKNGVMVVIKTTLEVPEYGIYYEQYGGNDNDDRGDAYKGAVTDAITKIGSYLGIGIEVFKGHATETSAPARRPTPYSTGEIAKPCSDCSTACTVAETGYSTKTFGRPLCRNCQAKIKSHDVAPF